MKRCPECRRDYTDDTLVFCLDDGSRLLDGPSDLQDEPATAIMARGEGKADAAAARHLSGETDPTRVLETERGSSTPSGESVDVTRMMPGYGGKGMAKEVSADRGRQRELEDAERSSQQDESLRRSPRRHSAYLDPKMALTLGLLVLIAGLAFLGYRYYKSASTETIGSIAVMPFVNESGNPDIEYLSDGMTETLIGSLSQLPNLTVKSRSSVFRYKGKLFDAKTVGRELGVQAILTGRFVQRANQLTVSLELVDVSTEDSLWSQQYNRDEKDLINLQSELARDVSRRLKDKLTGAEESKLTQTYTSDPEAYQLYLKGRYNLFKLTPAGIKAGIACFQQAIDTDPNYALAYVGLASAYRASALSADMPSAEFFPRAKAAAQKAVEIDDDLAEAHAVLGFTIFWYDWDWNTAETQLRRAIELNPNSADAHWSFAHLLSNLGRHTEALAEAKRARELDPLSLIINASEGMYLIDAGRPDEGLAQLQKTLEIEPNYWFAHLHASTGYCEKGMYQEAIAEARKAIELNSASSLPPAYLGYALAKSGRDAEARKVLEGLITLSAGHYVPPYHMALVYAGLNDHANMITWLQRGNTERDPKMTFLKVDPRWKGWIGDPDFEEVMKKVGFKE